MGEVGVYVVLASNPPAHQPHPACPVNSHIPHACLSPVVSARRGHITRYARAKMLVDSGSTDASSLVVRREGGAISCMMQAERGSAIVQQQRRDLRKEL